MPAHGSVLNNDQGSMVENGNGNEKGYSHGHGNLPTRAITPGGHPFEPTQPGFPVFHRKFANPAPLGLLSFACTTFVLSFYNTGSRGISTPNVVVGLALSYGGLAQLLAGMWEFAAGNTFGATAFTSFGAFWMSYGLIFWPSSGILDAYSGEAASQLPDALGFFLTGWTLVVLVISVAALRSSVALVSVFFFLIPTFILLAAGEFTRNETITKAGGAFGIVTAFAAFYTAMTGLLTTDTSYFLLPIGPLGPKH